MKHTAMLSTVYLTSLTVAHRQLDCVENLSFPMEVLYHRRNSLEMGITEHDLLVVLNSIVALRVGRKVSSGVELEQ